MLRSSRLILIFFSKPLLSFSPHEIVTFYFGAQVQCLSFPCLFNYLMFLTHLVLLLFPFVSSVAFCNFLFLIFLPCIASSLPNHVHTELPALRVKYFWCQELAIVAFQLLDRCKACLTVLLELQSIILWSCRRQKCGSPIKTHRVHENNIFHVHLVQLGMPAAFLARGS